MALGAAHPALAAKRVVTVQGLSGARLAWRTRTLVWGMGGSAGGKSSQRRHLFRQAAYSPLRHYQRRVRAAAQRSAARRLVCHARTVLTASCLLRCALPLHAGTGSLRVGAEFLSIHYPVKKVLIPSPTWPTHRAIFTKANMQVKGLLGPALRLALPSLASRW